MRKFLKKISFLASILSIMLIGINYMYINTEYFKNLNDVSKFSKIPQYIDIINLGSSHSQMAFDWSDYPEVNGVNAALPSQTLCYDESIFNQYFDRLSEKSVVIIGITYRSLYENQDDVIEGQKIARYYQILEKRYFPNWNLYDAIKNKYIPILGNKDNAIKAIIDEMFNKKDGSLNEQENIWRGYDYSQIESWGIENAHTFMKLSQGQELEEQYEGLIHIIEKCKNQDIQVILITLPTLPCFYETFSTEFKDKFYNDINTISETYNVPYSDYTGDKRIPVDGRIFYDADHLSEYGAKLFTEIFLEDHKVYIRDIGIE